MIMEHKVVESVSIATFYADLYLLNIGNKSICWVLFTTESQGSTRTLVSFSMHVSDPALMSSII